VATKKTSFLKRTSIREFLAEAVHFASPFLFFILLFASNAIHTIPIAMLCILLHRRAFSKMRLSNDSRYWFMGFVLFCLAMATDVNSSMSNGQFLLTISFVLVMLSESIDLPATTFYSNTMLSLTLCHEILFCLFTDFSLASVLNFIVLANLIGEVVVEKDSHAMAILFGCFIGVQAVGWTLNGGFFTDAIVSKDELVENWIKFISAPILGVLLFYTVRFTLESINNADDALLEES
tara:strand:+ start:1119 stop:1826 length:708 start_codon:yes stop_codon:yes gene_type:complete